MKTLRMLILGLLLVPSFVVLGATSALACSCIPPRPDKKAAVDAKAVFTGTVVDSKVKELGFSRGEWTFAVDTVYKGDVPATQVIHSHTQSAACGFVFDEGKRYAVFAIEGDPTMAADAELTTNSCMNTRVLPQGKELELIPVADFESDSLGPGSDLERDALSDDDSVVSPTWIAVAIGVVGLLAGLGRWWWFARRPGGPGTPEGPPA